MAAQNIPDPQFSKGDPVYVLSLDVVLPGTIGHSWLCRGEDENQFYGYDVKFQNGSHTTITDLSIGEEVFCDEISANKKADSVKSLYVKIELDKTQMETCRSFEYIRPLDGHKLTATVAKVGEDMLYEHGFYCYHFLRKYQNQKKRDDAFRKMLAKLLTETDSFGGTEVQDPYIDTLYKVTDELYASRGYAKSNLRLKQERGVA
jgi:hypothetical protein